MYTVAMATECPQYMAGVVGIMVKMSKDFVLRQKLLERGKQCVLPFAQRLKERVTVGFLDKVMSLLGYEATRFVALHTLLRITFYEGASCDWMYRDIAARIGTLERFLHGGSGDPRLTEVAMSVITHSMLFSLASQSENRVIPAEIPLLQTLAATISSLRNIGNHSVTFLVHALQLLVSPTEFFPEECLKERSLPSILVAFLRSKDIGTRGLALTGILNLCGVESEPDRHIVKIQHISDALDGKIGKPESFGSFSPEALQQLFDNSYARTLLESSLDYFAAMSQAAKDRDLCALGHTVARLFQQSTFIVDTEWKEVEDAAGISPSSPSPYTYCSDVLPECARSLRERGDRSDLVCADIIDMKFLLVCSRFQEAYSLAVEVLEREPRLAYAHHVISMGHYPARALLAAREGLLCPDVTPHLRQQFLWRAIEIASREAYKAMARRVNSIARCQASAAILRTALVDGKTLISEMAPDNPLLLTILGWNIVNTIVVQGDQLGSTLQGLEVSH